MVYARWRVAVPCIETFAQLPQRVRRTGGGSARAGGGERSADLVTCCDCQARFRLFVSNANWFKDKGLTPAARCKHCRLYRQARPARAAQRRRALTPFIL